jgi:hypothetical protein
MRTVPATQLLTPEAQRLGRYITSSVVALDIIQRRAAAGEAAPAVQYVIVMATPTPQPPSPTAAPHLVAAPPTAEPEIVEQTVEETHARVETQDVAFPHESAYVPDVPNVADVHSAAQIEPPAEPTPQWHPPFVRPECMDWHPPLTPIEGCP